MKNNIPVMPNIFPFNDMLLDGHLALPGAEGVKTRSWNWKYRGPVLLYNSTRKPCKVSAKAYNYTDSPERHRVIIGMGEVFDVRPLNSEEGIRMLCNFNNVGEVWVRKILRRLGLLRKPWNINNYREGWKHNLVSPLEIGIFFRNLKRFLIPVPFNWPAGPTRPLTINIDSVPNLKAVMQIPERDDLKNAIRWPLRFYGKWPIKLAVR